MDYLAKVAAVVGATMKEKWVAIADHPAADHYYPLDIGSTSPGWDMAYSDCSHLLLRFDLFL